MDSRNGRRLRGRRPFAFVLMTAAVAACSDPASRHGVAQRNVVDSIFPVDEEVRRFKAALAPGSDRTQLMNAANSRDELMRRFIRALEHYDSATIRALVLDGAEFIDLYYPVSIYSRPPYKQSPALLWFLMQQDSEKGISRLIQRYGGQPTGFSTYQCDEKPTVEGDVRLWKDCQMTWRLNSRMRAFGAIIEHHGRFKFLSYINDL